MTLQVLFYTGNHKSKVGIEDIVNLISQVFNSSNDFTCEISNDLLPGYDVIFVIEEFALQKNVDKILVAQKELNNSTFILVCTEFVTKTRQHITFNSFGSVFENSALKILRILTGTITKNYKDIQINVIFTFPLDLVMAFIWTILFLKNNKLSLKALYKKIRELSYFDMRYLNFKNVLKEVKLFTTTHPIIQKQILDLQQDASFIGDIYPLIKTPKMSKATFFSGDHKIIKMSGNLTTYRFNKMKELKANLSTDQTKTRFIISSLKNPEVPNHRSDFTFNPPQNENWKYCSPIRICRSWNIDESIPLITKYFGQHPIENTAIHLRKKSTFRIHSINLDEMKNRIAQYNEIALRVNQKTLYNIKNLHIR